MENIINIAELLKDCPKGMELDCTMFENVKLEYVDERKRKDIYYPIKVTLEDGFTISFTKYGQYSLTEYAKCVIFPKGKTTWEGFVPPCKFKDGDIVSTANGMWIGIVKRKVDNAYETYTTIYGATIYHDDIFCFERFATEYEKQKLFDALKVKGYKWNADTKTLEKLIEPWTIQDAKNGDVLAFDDETIVIFKDLYNKTSFHSYCHIEEGIFTISKEDMPDWWQGRGFYPATEEQRTLLFQKIKEAGYHWNAETKTLEKLVKPKFKVGDIIQDEAKYKMKIIEVHEGDECYIYESSIAHGIGSISFNDQDSFELVPNKFDMSTLKPFDKVLVRDNNEQLWVIDLFGFHDDRMVYKFMCVGHNVNQCIPYEGNEHLLGTTDDCDEFYKNWE